MGSLGSVNVRDRRGGGFIAWQYGVVSFRSGSGILHEVSHSETEATSGSDDEEEVVYSEAHVRSVWHQLELERYKDKNGTANVTNLSARFCSAGPAA